MADLTVTVCRPVQIIEQATFPTSATTVRGQMGKFDSNGKVNLALATTANNAKTIGMAISDSAATGGRVTFVRKGYLDLGTALDALAFEAIVYLSDTAGTLADAAGTSSKVVGTVVPSWGQTTAERLLRIDL